jgi:hypothetical protein
MSLRSAIAEYFAPLRHDGVAHRKQNMSVAEANKAASDQVLEDELKHWRTVAREQPSRWDEAMDRLDEIRVMRTAT